MTDAELNALKKQVEEHGELLRVLVDNINALRDRPKPAPVAAVEGSDSDPEVAKLRARRK